MRISDWSSDVCSSDLVTGHQQDGLPLEIKGKGNPPHAVSRVEPKLLHVGVARPLQRVHPRPAQLWAEGLKKFCLRKELVLHLGRQRIELDRKSTRLNSSH